MNLSPEVRKKHGILKRVLNLESTEICSLLIEWLYDVSAVHFLIYEMGLKFLKTLIRDQMWWSSMKHFEVLFINDNINWYYQEITALLFKWRNTKSGRHRTWVSTLVNTMTPCISGQVPSFLLFVLSEAQTQGIIVDIEVGNSKGFLKAKCEQKEMSGSPWLVMLLLFWWHWTSSTDRQ